jgi:hypothetical protein
MESKVKEPPGFTSDDTSYEASLTIPFLSLGEQKWIGRKDNVNRLASFRQTDISGAHISSLFASHTLTVILNPNQVKKSPSKNKIGDSA